MRTITITLENEEAERLEAIANVIQGKLADFIADEILPEYLEAIQGNVGANVAARIYDRLNDARRAAKMADKLDGEASDWHFYRTAGNDIRVECSDAYHADRIAEGCELIKGKVAA